MKVQFYLLQFYYGFKYCFYDFSSNFIKSIFFILFLFCYSTVWEKMGRGSEYILYVIYAEMIFFALPETVRTHLRIIIQKEVIYLEISPVSYALKEILKEFGAGIARSFFLFCVGIVFYIIRYNKLPPIIFFHMAPFAFISIFLLSSFQWSQCWLGFWFKNVFPISMIWQKFILICGGVLIPISLMPILMQKFCFWLPFYESIYVLSANASGLTNKSINIIAWIFWVFVGYGLQYVIYNVGFKKLSME